MTEADRIKQLLRDATSITELRGVWKAEMPAILSLPETMRTQITNLKTQRKGQLE